AFLDQIQELQATVGVLLGNGNNQAQVGLNHFLLGATSFRLTDRHPAVDFLDVGHVQIHFGLNVLDALLQANDFVHTLTDRSRIGLLGGGDFAGPLQIGFVSREPLVAVFAWIFAISYAT